MESHIKSPSQFTLRGRTKFGDPNEKAMSKSAASEPGPGQYDLGGRFLSGSDPRKSAFPKGSYGADKSLLQGPGPGAYQCPHSMGRQALSTSATAAALVFGKAARPSMVPPGTTDIGPGEYRAAPAACDPQVDSRKPTCALMKFGEGYRKGGHRDRVDLSEPSPGPGSYTLPGGIATATKGAPFTNSPAISISGRQKFGSPFGW
jgi:hypothetical protein